jgi:GH24 family phage-related lysozyme (muramidase)
MRLSEKGAAFIARHESFVSTAYRDPVGVLTIGYGFTMRSRVFASYWRTKHGRALRMGDVIGRDEAASLLRTMVAEEYGAAVNRAFSGLEQHQYDACCSIAFNLGPKSLTWRWARALKAGDVEGAADILSRNYNTADGRKLKGLVRRRREEAALLLHGDYGNGTPHGSSDDIAEDRASLLRLGYDVDNWPVAVRTFQRDNPPLVVDGIFGPASRATARRLLSKRATKKTSGAAGVAAGGGAAVSAAEKATEIDWTTIAVGLGTAGAVAVLLYVAWVNRGNIWNALPAWLQDRLSGLVSGD